MSLIIVPTIVPFIIPSKKNKQIPQRDRQKRALVEKPIIGNDENYGATVEYKRVGPPGKGPCLPLFDDDDQSREGEIKNREEGCVA